MPCMDAVLGAPIFYRLWGRLRRTDRRRVTRELVSVAMAQGRSPEPMWTSALPAMRFDTRTQCQAWMTLGSGLFS